MGVIKASVSNDFSTENMGRKLQNSECHDVLNAKKTNYLLKKNLAGRTEVGKVSLFLHELLKIGSHNGLKERGIWFY